jgi:hypothetical protein
MAHFDVASPGSSIRTFAKPEHVVVPERTSWTSEMVYEIDFEIVRER